jgi:DNA-binding PadR family transcriptional regulator
MPNDQLTTTSYVVLAQLAMRPWSAYELATQQQRYFQYFWPRARSGLYQELKKLAQLGVANAETIPVGRRGHRTMYSITAAGRQALRAWLDEPLTPISVEFEGLVRIFAAPAGTRDQLLHTLGRIADDADELAAFNDGIRHEYIGGRAPFQDQAHVRTLAVDLMTDYFDLIRDWAQRSRAAVERWPDLDCDDARQHQARERVRRARDTHPD